MQSLHSKHVDDSNQNYPCLLNQKIRFFTLNSLIPHDIPKWFSRGNTCILKWNNYYILNIRNVNYFIDEKGLWYHANSDKSTDSCNEFIILDPLNMTLKYYKRLGITQPFNKCCHRGLEDIRIIHYKDSLYYTASIQNPQNYRIEISTDYYAFHLNELPLCRIKSPFEQHVEKNWSMFIHKDILKYVYSWSPFQVGVISNQHTLEIIHQKYYPENFFSFIKNSSIGVWDVEANNIWFLVHINSANPSFRTYYHAIIILDGDSLDIIRISKCFTFERQKIEYCLGFVLEKDRLVFTYTTFDLNPRIIEVPRVWIESLFQTYLFSS